MTEEIINTCEYYKICESACGGTLEDTELCSCYELYKQLKHLEQENARLKNENIELQEKFLDLNGKSYSYRKALEEIREMFCVGRTFYEGYFDNENLSRGDKTIKIINEVLK